jgi:hypothetical protein
MNLGGIPSHNDLNNVGIGKGHVSELNTENMFFYLRKDMTGKVEYTFHPIIFQLFDRIIRKDTLSGVSIDQERFIKRFFYEAGKITDAMNGKSELPDNLTDAAADFDKFLGSSEVIADALNMYRGLQDSMDESSEEVIKQKLKEIEVILKDLKLAQTNSDSVINELLEHSVYVR